MARRPGIGESKTARDFRAAVVARWKKIWGSDRAIIPTTASLDDDEPRIVYNAPSREPLRYLGRNASPGMEFLGRGRTSNDEED